MDATYIRNAILQLKNTILMHVRHRTLLTFTGEPIVDEDHLFCLLLPFFNGDRWLEEHEQSAVTVGIVYSALNAHDQIEETDATSKGQQLTVLAGDYYSGMYYQLLANASNLQLIRLLSRAVAETSEMKTSIYEPVSRSFDEWMETLQVIESKPIEQFAKCYGFEKYIPIIKNLLLLKRLKTELDLLKNGETNRYLEAAQYGSLSSNNLDELEEKLQQETYELSLALEHTISTATFLADYLKKQLANRIAPFLCGRAEMTREG